MGRIVSPRPDESKWQHWRKRPVVIRAQRLEVKTTIRTLEGTMIGNPGDWLIEGVKGEIYPCKDNIFRETYERVVE